MPGRVTIVAVTTPDDVRAAKLPISRDDPVPVSVPFAVWRNLKSIVRTSSALKLDVATMAAVML